MIMDFFGLGAAAGNLIGGAIQGHKNRKFAKQMLQAQVAQQDKVNAQAMAYQDKVNQQNRDWNTEKNVRARVEEAGYNPYLYNGQASASGSDVASAANLGNSVSPVETNVDYGLQSLGTNAIAALRGALDYTKEDYDFNRRMKIDERNDAAQGGIGSSESAKTQEELKIIRNQSIISSVDAKFADIRSGVADMQAFDENSMPITDGDGNPMTVGQAKEYDSMRQLDLAVKNAHSALVNSVEQGKILSEDAIMKHFERLHIQPQELSKLRSEIGKIVADTNLAIAQIRVSNAQVSNIKADTGLKAAQTRLTDVMRSTERWKSLTQEQQERALKISNAFLYDEKLSNLLTSTSFGRLNVTQMAGFALDVLGDATANVFNKNGDVNVINLRRYLQRKFTTPGTPRARMAR